MTTTPQPAHRNQREHTLPWFWPVAAAFEAGEAGLRLFRQNMEFAAQAENLVAPPPAGWASPNDVRLDLDTLRLRDFSTGSRGPCVLVVAPYAGHGSTIADLAPDQSLVRTLLDSRLQRVLVTDWKAATSAMRDFDIDKYLAEINVVVDDLGGNVHLVGLCQGGWMSAMYAARFPAKVASLVLAGAPIDTAAGHGPLKNIVHTLPASFYDELVATGGGLMRGRFMLAGWKNMHPDQQYLGKFIDLYEHVEDRNYVERTDTFERWYENPVDLPGRYYLQAIHELFIDNRFARGEFVGLGRRLSLGDVHCPAYLLAGSSDDITPKAQVFAAAGLLGTPPAQVVREVAQGGHIGLFMGRRTLAEQWPVIARWIAARGR
ncbi:MAG TPA: alpha/beta fold hydrolase [Burkholderiaceae bacterium]